MAATAPRKRYGKRARLVAGVKGARVDLEPGEGGPMPPRSIKRGLGVTEAIAQSYKKEGPGMTNPTPEDDRTRGDRLTAFGGVNLVDLEARAANGDSEAQEKLKALYEVRKRLLAKSQGSVKGAAG